MVKVLVVGAGASYAECLNLGAEENLCLPLMRNFARKTWKEFNPHPYLDRYLDRKGYQVVSEDGREKFFELEETGEVNIEGFFEFCWENKEKSWGWSDNPRVRQPGMVMDFKPSRGNLPKDFIKGSRLLYDSPTTIKFVPEEMDFWNNMMCQGIGRPFKEMLMHIFSTRIVSANKLRIKELTLSKKIISTLVKSDIVINLNYDPIFEVGLKQAGRSFVYSPHLGSNDILVCKPHGALNLIINAKSFEFEDPVISWATLEPPLSHGGYKYLGLIPPRLNKSYEQNSIAKVMLNSIMEAQPDSITFWGVGFAKSDVDLLELFKKWSNQKNRPAINVINPSADVSRNLSELLDNSVNHFYNAESYVHKHGGVSYSISLVSKSC